MTGASSYRARLVGMGSLFALLVLGSASGVCAQEPVTPPVSISQLSGNLYLMKSGSDATVFFVADDGILLVDPLSPQTAQTLKGELSKRYPDRPIRYVVLTSHRFDRASGAREVKDDAELIGHERFASELSRSAQALTSILAPLDTNRDGRLSASELAGTSVANAVLSKDRDGDGLVTPDELYRNVLLPTSLFAR